MKYVEKKETVGMILSVMFDLELKLFALNRLNDVQYLNPNATAFSPLPNLELCSLAQRELIIRWAHGVVEEFNPDQSDSDSVSEDHERRSKHKSDTIQ
ncbi:hypothetical protein L1987_01637 [Smallanthus sonchifolius]|uniref:Uncharacterized protein n=1 Tax=Smallanthus sonchifolius TaxID=185202 RepID=A0ACB9K5S4_9ASTR|nr:hypothetical protein L1987_01637 [Smallanthus sonchifolius]